MPFNILLVEDEGAASRYLRSIVELKCPGFAVAAVAEDGAAGLEAARSLRPDLVITDIRMPRMDGLEFVRALKRELPDVPAVIVSGYQEFEYARAALGTGVVEYLLKPVSAGGLAAALAAVRPRLEANAARRTRATLAALLAGTCDPGPGDDGYGQYAAAAAARWWLALFREGGLPSRFGRESGTLAEDVGRSEGDFHALGGRDGRERCFLAPRERMDLDTFSRRVRAEAGFAEAEGARGPSVPAAARTLVFAARDLAGGELEAGARELRRTLDRAIVLGEAKIAYGTAAAPTASDWEPVLADRLEFCLANSRYDDLEKAVRGAVAAWRAERRPLFRTEAALRKLLHFVQRKTLGPGESDEDLEYYLDAGMAGAADWDALADEAWTLTRRAAGIAETEAATGGAKADAPAFFAAILRHVDEHYGRPLSLSSVAEAFRISETYLSKLFRKHLDKSFGEYLTFRRIESAKRLMAESPDMPLKDVASCVGFQDPFYFSRVFKAATGVPPSEYR